MAEEILLDYAINRPHVSLHAEETELKVLLKINASHALREAPEPIALPVHVALVLDVSSSMRPREIEGLKQAARAAIDQLRPGDFVTVVAFQSVVYDIVAPTRIEDSSTRALVKARVEVIDQFQGGGTNMEYALTRAEHQLASVPGELVRKIIVFTDGQITGPVDGCLRRAAQISERGIGIDALGFGQEFDYKFTQRLAGFSNGYTAKIDRPEEIQAVFAQRVKDVASAIAMNVRLDLHFTPQIRARRGWRVSPEISYMGTINLPGEQRNILIPVGALERDKEVAFIITCVAPKRPAGKVRIMKADLHYDIPALGIVNGSSTQSIILSYTDDQQQLAELNGEVEQAFDEAEIGRMVEALDRAMARGVSAEVAQVFDALIERHHELGDAEMGKHYEQLKQKFAAEGKISQEDMNYTRHKSTQKRTSGAQLVDASSLI